MQDTIRTFLISLDADKTRHSGRSLYDHLKGVHDLLRDWDNEHHVCMAGLFHSIYGTKTFKHKSLNDRAKLIEMIGLKAELLVHYFSTKDRPFFESIEDKNVRRNLLEIEAANLLEQGGNVNTLRKLAGMRELSNGARAALNCGVV
jgi:(p)ppGpp synthase/HD superfamily hydrolase